MSSTTANKKKKRTIRFWAVAVWLFVWQAVSVWIGQEILLVSPVVVLERLTGLVMETEFWRSIGFSLVRILGGFFLAAAAGILAAGLSAKFERIREFFAPAVMVVKAVPVASFIILVLIWVPSPEFVGSDFILMVFPILTRMCWTVFSVRILSFSRWQMFSHFPTQCGSVTFMFPKYCRFQNRVFHRPWTLLESRGGGRGHRDSRRFHRGKALQCQGISQYAGSVCMDGGDCPHQPAV